MRIRLRERGGLGEGAWITRRSGSDIAPAVRSAPDSVIGRPLAACRRGGRVCPPVGDMRVGVSGPGRAVFKLYAPRIDVPTETALDMTLQVVIGNRCSVGTLPFTALQQRGRALVYP